MNVEIITKDNFSQHNFCDPSLPVVFSVDFSRVLAVGATLMPSACCPVSGRGCRSLLNAANVGYAPLDRVMAILLL